MSLPDEIKILMKLGLTTNQAKIYLALIGKEPSTAYQISKLAALPCPVVYNAMQTLQERGIVERLISKPILFQAIPVERAFKFLLNRKNAEQQEIQNEAEMLLEKIKTKNYEILKDYPPENNDLYLIPTRENLDQDLVEVFEKTKKTWDVVTSQQASTLTYKNAENMSKAVKRFLRRGGKVRIAIDDKVTEHPTIWKDLQLSHGKSDLYQIRYFHGEPDTLMVIFDNKETFVKLSAGRDCISAPTLRSRNVCCIALARNYFETKWQNSYENPESSQTSNKA